MPKHEAIDGIGIRTRDMGDKNRYLSVLTAEAGRITLLSNGSHSIHSRQMADSQLYSYANFEYYRKGSARILKGGSVLRNFYSLSTDINRMNLAAYLCELTEELTDEGVEASEMLRLLLNSLYAIGEEIRPQEQIKGAFELRAAALSGYAPDLSGCARCGKSESDPFYLDVMNGALLCTDCRGKANALPRDAVYAEDLRQAEILSLLSPAVCRAARYCIEAPLERLLSFELKEAGDLADFARAAETYILSHIGHGFASLQFYRQLLEPTKI